MSSLLLPLPGYKDMVYTMENGARVATTGPVVIEGIRHRVRECYVACDSGLNNRAWNVTEELEICRECYPVQSIKVGPQIGLFEEVSA
jgi:hypothetical protein